MLNESIVLFILALIIALYVLKGIALTSPIQVGVGGTVKSYSIIPSSIRGPLMIVYLLAQIFLIIYAFCKCSKIKKNSKEV